MNNHITNSDIVGAFIFVVIFIAAGTVVLLMLPPNAKFIISRIRYHWDIYQLGRRTHAMNMAFGKQLAERLAPSFDAFAREMEEMHKAAHDSGLIVENDKPN